MADNQEKNPPEAESVQLNDLEQELTEKQLEDVKGGDLKTSSRPIVTKVVIRP
ncbi:hypothetical protein [Cohnella fermenti]|uniref:hypothetical protein n=1 Tax=Cohnella fermenti TaxID=2565925 RepID=UPI001454D6C7|nr:hypothetical protein [Cohnella fermenti]